MTNTKSVASKLFVGFVVTSMLFTLSFKPAKADEISDLQTQINALLAQIAALQGGGSTGGSSCPTFTMDLTIGSTGAEVTSLQNFLMGHGQTIPAGATGYFGSQTQAALAGFQAANAISPAVGYFGPITRAKVNGMCVVVPPADDTSDDTSDDDSSDDDSVSLGGEASLDDVSMNDGDDTNIEEGQEDAPIAEVEVEFVDGDAQISRIDLGFVATGSEEDPWDTFSDISLWVDGDKVASVNADDEDDWLDEDAGTIRISGLDIVGMEDEKVTIVIGVTVQNSVDNMPATWRVDTEAIRFFDADDVATTEDATGDIGTGDGVTFDIDSEGADDEVIVKSSSEDPDATTIAVEEDTKSDWTTIFAFDLDTDDSTNDIEVNELYIDLYSSNDNVVDMISDMKLVVDGEEFEDYSTLVGAANSASTTFDLDGDLVIDAGDRVTVELQVEFKAQSGNYDNGDDIVASTTGATGDFEGADDVVGEGSATGETHTLRTEGAIIEAGDMTEVKDENDDTSTTDDEGIFTIKFEVTAFETDLYIDDTATGGTAEYNTGVNFQFLTTADAVAATSSLSASLTSTASKEAGRYKVAEGETETFTLTVVADPVTGGFHKLQLYSVNWNNTNDDADTQQRALPVEDFETDPLEI